ncbi:class I SAM-dependent methyltransferase [Candidatus Sumerlaeota bacterium]|nr:class I SAM-dependent methyltransferase [Candidatus Sumerlaeota bacterium]
MSHPQHAAKPEMAAAQILELSMSYAPSRCLASALQLGVFSHIHAGNRDVNAIAMAAGASPRGIRMLLDALTALGFLTKKKGQYSLTNASAEYLVKSSPDYMGAVMEMDTLWKSWSHLTECVRDGKPYQAVDEQERAEAFFPHLVRGLHVSNREPARAAAKALGAGGSHKAMHVLDVACGSGIWGISIAEADPAAKVTFQDFPTVLELTREYAKRHAVDARSEFLAGDLREVDFGHHRFDLALLGNIVHSEGEPSSRDLFKKLYRALKPGGRIAVIDMIPNEERTGPPFPLIFALNMLVNTRAGDTYTLAEYTQWLNESGFDTVETAEIASHSPMIVGTRV